MVRHDEDKCVVAVRLCPVLGNLHRVVEQDRVIDRTLHVQCVRIFVDQA